MNEQNRALKGIRSHNHELDSNTFLVAYRPVWTPRGLAAHLRYVKIGTDDWVETPLGEINLSSLHELDLVARTLRLFDKASGDWHYELAKFFGAVIAEERSERSPVKLLEVAAPGDELTLNLDGWPLLIRHPTILFGDGESAKSYLALWLAGRLTQEGRRVLYCDWELSAEDHRVRLERLFPNKMPDVHYLACKAPISELVEDIQRYAVDERIDYLICDSVAFACSGPPETSEAATSYFAAVRDIGVAGSLHIAHTTKRTNTKTRDSANPTKPETNDKPFGSAFWHNSARATWMLSGKKNADQTQITGQLKARKNNLTSRGDDLIATITFDNKARHTTVQLSSTAPPTSLKPTASISGGSSREDEVMAFVKGNAPCSRNAIYEAVGGDKSALLKLVKTLIKQGWLDTNKKGRIVLGK